MDRQEVEWALKVNLDSLEDLDPKEKEDHRVRMCFVSNLILQKLAAIDSS